MVPMSKLLHVYFAGSELLTGLPEYRNGGLLIDTGLLTLKPEQNGYYREPDSEKLEIFSRKELSILRNV